MYHRVKLKINYGCNRNSTKNISLIKQFTKNQALNEDYNKQKECYVNLALIKKIKLSIKTNLKIYYFVTKHSFIQAIKLKS